MQEQPTSGETLPCDQRAALEEDGDEKAVRKSWVLVVAAARVFDGRSWMVSVREGARAKTEEDIATCRSPEAAVVVKRKAEEAGMAARRKELGVFEEQIGDGECQPDSMARNSLIGPGRLDPQLSSH